MELDIWRGEEHAAVATGPRDYDETYLLVKEEVMPDGKTKLILKDKTSGRIVEQVK